jgi:hypothetical protein
MRKNARGEKERKKGGTICAMDPPDFGIVIGGRFRVTRPAGRQG